MQHMVLSLSTRVCGGLSVHSLSENNNTHSALLCFYSNNGYANAPRCYLLCTLRIFFPMYGLENISRDFVFVQPVDNIVYLVVYLPLFNCSHCHNFIFRHYIQNIKKKNIKGKFDNEHTYGFTYPVVICNLFYVFYMWVYNSIALFLLTLRLPD